MWFLNPGFTGNTKGNVALVFAMASVILVGLAGGTVDFMSISSANRHLQSITDNAVLASARELQLSGSTGSKDSHVMEIAKAYITSAIKHNLTLTDIKATVSADKGSVKLDVFAKTKVRFLQFMGFEPIKTISASATAQSYSGLPLCVLALENERGHAIGAYSKSQLKANHCTIYSNSTAVSSIEAWGSSIISSGLTCAAGGVAGGVENYPNQAISDCPKVPDPLASRIPPAIGGCDFNNFEVNGGKATLMPGVYCGGLKIHGKAKVFFSAGDYIIKDGKFEITATTKVEGQDVGFYLTGPDAIIGFHGKADISFKGRESGAMAGLLFFEDPDRETEYVHEITTDYARILEGTIYFPHSEFRISAKNTGNGNSGTTGAGTSEKKRTDKEDRHEQDSDDDDDDDDSENSGIASESAYTVIVTRMLTLNSGPKLVLNTDYASSPVPLPRNISRMSGNITLVK